MDSVVSGGGNRDSARDAGSREDGAGSEPDVDSAGQGVARGARASGGTSGDPELGHSSDG